MKMTTTKRRQRRRRRSQSRSRGGGGRGRETVSSTTTTTEHPFPETQCPAVPRAEQKRHGCVRNTEARRKLEQLPGNTFADKVARLFRSNGEVRRACPATTDADKRRATTCALERGAGIRAAAATGGDDVPRAPDEWAKDPQLWLSNLDIDGFLKYLARHDASVEFVPFATIDFDGSTSGSTRGSCYNEQLCRLNVSESFGRRGKKHVIVSMNLGEFKTSGYHWVSIYAYAGSSVEAPFMYYFDSARTEIGSVSGGRGIVPGSVQRLHAKWSKQMAPKAFPLESNRRQHQQGTNNCGVYSVYFFALMTSPLNEPLRFPIRPPSSSSSSSSSTDEERQLYPTFHTQQEKLTWLENHVMSDEDVQYYRTAFFK